jgi:hypothetical protein
MAGIQDFITSAAAKLGIGQAAAGSATGGLASLIQKGAGAADFGKLAAAVPGLSDLAAKGGAAEGPGAGGMGGMLGGLAKQAGGLLGGAGGGAGGALAAVTGAGVAPDKAAGFLSMFVGFLKSKVPPDVLKSVLGKVPGLSALVA